MNIDSVDAVLNQCPLQFANQAWSLITGVPANKEECDDGSVVVLRFGSRLTRTETKDSSPLD